MRNRIRLSGKTKPKARTIDAIQEMDWALMEYRKASLEMQRSLNRLLVEVKSFYTHLKKIRQDLPAV